MPRPFFLAWLSTAAVVLAGCGEAPPESSKSSAAPANPAGPSESEIDEEEAQALRALGYIGVADPVEADAHLGVVEHDAQRAAQGLSLFSNANSCTAQLIDMDGQVLHEWAYSPCFRFATTSLLPNGDLLLVGRTKYDKQDPAAGLASRFMLRMNWAGEVLWMKRMTSHHDVEETPDGRIATLTERHVIVPDLHAEVPVRDQGVALLSPTGDVLEEVSILDVLRSAPELHTLLPTEPRFFEGGEELDLMHANSVGFLRDAELAERDPLYSRSNVMVCMRNQNAVIVFDWESKQLLWSWGQGELSGPHDATLLANGNVMIFDNGLGRGWSRVVEVDPFTREIVWQYRAPEPRSFYTFTRGSAQRLSNGNTLLVSSNQARAFEVTADGDIVWDFMNFNMTKRREPIAIVRMRRYEGVDYDELRARAAAGTIEMQD